MEQRVGTRGRVTADDYFQVEARSSIRHEFRGGRIIAMAGGTEPHSLIITNSIIGIGQRLKGSGCRTYESNLRVLSSEAGDYSYPDITVVCGPAQFADTTGSRKTVTNPRLIVEVLSPSTAADDRGPKFDAYRAIPTVEQYVLIERDRPHVQTFLRQTGGSWLMQPYVGMNAVVVLSSLNVELPMSEIYTDVIFPNGLSTDDDGE